MSKTVTILLLEDVASLGTTGDIVTVSEGHARNFLFPEGKAALADDRTRQQARDRRERQQAASDQALVKVQVLAEKLEGTELTLQARLKEGAGDEIYGHITARQIADELNRAAKLSVKASDVKLTKPIARVGSEDVVVQLSPEVEITIRVTTISHEET